MLQEYEESAQQAPAFDNDLSKPLVRQATNQAENQKTLNFIFGVIFLTNLMINVDHGILPACTKEVKKDLHLDDANLGLLGSLVYAGLVIGSLFAMPIFNYGNTKFVLIVCLLLNSFALLLFTLTDKYSMLVISRVSVGFFQVFFCIYFPVWVDLFADEKRKTVWLTLLLLGVPLGIIIGYLSTAIIVMYSDWRLVFYIQSGFIVPLAMCFMLTPSKFIVFSGYANITDNDTTSKRTESMNFYNLSGFESKNKGTSFHRRGSSNINIAQSQQSQNRDPDSPSFALNKTKTEDQSFTQTKTQIDSRYRNLMANNRRDGIDSMRDPNVDKSNLEKNSDYNNRLKIQHQIRNHSRADYQLQGMPTRGRANSIETQKYRKKQQRELRKAQKMVENYTLKQKIMYLLTNFNFMLLLLAMTGVYFVTTGIQFWITDYFMNVLGQTKNKAFITFTIICISGPILGVIVGGYIFNSIGGYNSPQAYPLAVFVMCLGASCGFPLVFVTNFYLVSFLLWGQFFFGGFCMPVLTGILLNTCPASLRTIANSIANLVYNLLGYLPAPYIYGLIYQLDGSGESRAGMLSLQISAVASSALLGLLLIKMRALEKKQKATNQTKNQLSQGGAALDILDNDQIGPLLSKQSDDESVMRSRRKVASISSVGEDSDDEYGTEKRSFKTPVSDRIKLESTSVLYSKSVYPLSLGIHEED
ncbi:major facilitator superfamily protein [Stylonychia lemnae]|uniref:Major facilitator superfamily protein n=1 Tax=Stylonychia lemnae TaxID=5949 RepID=A0A078B500_STYLE|nr:major facilitator superfamily protein [Stylonychia lemnae]|eukprot:CDW89605.1 major facilitator superfamily protein [Stylonychia lemnae]